MVTVSFIGGPRSHFNIFSALRSWLSPDEAVVPEQEIFTPGQTPQQVVKQDVEEMANSQQTATVAALCQLKISFKTVDTVRATTKGMPAAGVLQPGDVITAVDDRDVPAPAELVTIIQREPVGAQVALSFVRGGRPHKVVISVEELPAR